MRPWQRQMSLGGNESETKNYKCEKIREKGLMCLGETERTRPLTEMERISKRKKEIDWMRVEVDRTEWKNCPVWWQREWNRTHTRDLKNSFPSDERRGEWEEEEIERGHERLLHWNERFILTLITFKCESLRSFSLCSFRMKPLSLCPYVCYIRLSFSNPLLYSLHVSVFTVSPSFISSSKAKHTHCKGFRMCEMRFYRFWMVTVEVGWKPASNSLQEYF